jgi:hypothetical protein
MLRDVFEWFGVIPSGWLQGLQTDRPRLHTLQQAPADQRF